MLNTDEVADLAKQRWGDILHPTITDIVLMVVGLVCDNPGLSMDDVDMWKTDLRGAYTLMSFKSTNCMKFAVELVNDITIIFLCGPFGWSSTPAAFQVITRAILFQLKGLLLGLALMYVDDIIGVSARVM